MIYSKRIGVLAVRTGKGTVTEEDGQVTFTDQVGTASRVATLHSHGWWSVQYLGLRYQLFGGIRTPYFICLNSPVRGRKIYKKAG